MLGRRRADSDIAVGRIGIHEDVAGWHSASGAQIQIVGGRLKIDFGSVRAKLDQLGAR